MLALVLRVTSAVFVMIVVILGGASCKITTTSERDAVVSESDVANHISDFVNGKLGHKPDSVNCPGDLKGPVGTTMNCQVTVAGQSYPIFVKVTAINGSNATYEVEGERMSRDTIVGKVSAWAAGRLGHQPNSVTCPDDLWGFVGFTMTCQVADAGRNNPVNVKVTAVNGNDVRYDIG